MKGFFTMANNNSMGLTELEEISEGVAGIADLLAAISVAQDNGGSFERGIYFLQVTAFSLAKRLNEYKTQAFAKARAETEEARAEKAATKQ